MNEEKSSFIKGINEQRPTAYHQLYNEYYKALVLYAINFLSSQQAAEDIVQDLFATMWEKKMRFLSLPSFRTYLYNSIRNASLNYLKHQNVESLYLERLAALSEFVISRPFFLYNFTCRKYLVISVPSIFSKSCGLKSFIAYELNLGMHSMRNSKKPLISIA